MIIISKLEKMPVAILLAGGIYFVSGGVHAQVSPPSEVIAWADTILVNGQIVSMDNDSLDRSVGTTAPAMAVRDGKVLSLGTNAEIEAMAGPNTIRVDLAGRTVIPGLIDTHSHLYSYANHRSRPRPADLQPTQGGWDTLEGEYETWNEIIPALVAEVKRRAAAQEPGTRIFLTLPKNGYLSEGEYIFAVPFVQRNLGLDLPPEKKLTEAELRAIPLSRARLDKLAPDHLVHIRFGNNVIFPRFTGHLS